jgi:hypothetical protein
MVMKAVRSAIGKERGGGERGGREGMQSLGLAPCITLSSNI